MKKITLFSLYFICLLSILPGTVTAAPVSRYSANGAEVTDTQTGLVWKRCAEGMNWNGTTCMGAAALFTHEGALQTAVQAGSSWRLPNVKELSSIVDKNITTSPAVDSNAFPATPPNLFWTSTPFAANTSYAWIVDFSVGTVAGNPRSNSPYPTYVRLVRDGP